MLQSRYFAHMCIHTHIYIIYITIWYIHIFFVFGNIVIPQPQTANKAKLPFKIHFETFRLYWISYYYYCYQSTISISIIMDICYVSLISIDCYFISSYTRILIMFYLIHLLCIRLNIHLHMVFLEKYYIYMYILFVCIAIFYLDWKCTN